MLLGGVAEVDIEARSVVVDDRCLSYDILAVATGARHAYFGHDDWGGVRTEADRDATAIRRRTLIAFERAEAAEDPVERKRLLVFAVIGARTGRPLRHLEATKFLVGADRRRTGWSAGRAGEGGPGDDPARRTHYPDRGKRPRTADLHPSLSGRRKHRS